MRAGQAHGYRFDGFTVDLDRARLLHAGDEIPLRPKSFEALRFLVENRSRLATKEELIRALWPNACVTDDSLVKCIGDVRQALACGGRSYVRTVPRRGYIFEAEVVEAGPPTAAGAPPIPPAPPPETGQARGRSPLVVGRGVMGLLAAVVLLAGVAWLVRGHVPGANGPPAHSVAVLPFENLSPDPDNAYFAAGIHESVLNQLAKLEHVNTISRTVVLRYADRGASPREIADALNVETVMEGSVRYADGRVVVTAQLINPQTGLHIWSEAYDREFADIFVIQADIARRIATALDAELSPADRRNLERQPTRSADAWQLYLKGRYRWDTWLASEIRKSIDYYEQAIRIDPQFALAWAGLADAYTALHGLGAAAPNEAMLQAKRAAARALAIDPELAAAHVSMGLIQHFYDWDYAGGNASFLRAIELEPDSATAHHLYGKNLPVTSSFEHALEELAKALELEPYSIGINKDIGETLYYARRYDEAVEAFERTLELEPDYALAWFWLARCYEAQGRRRQALEVHGRRMELFRTEAPGAASLAALPADDWNGDWTGYWEAYRRGLEQDAMLMYVDPYRFVEASMRLGDTEQALVWLEECFEARCAWMPTIAMDPLLDPLRGDPRFDDLLRRAGLHRRR